MVDGRHDLLLARMGIGGEPDGTCADRGPLSRASSAASTGSGAGGEFQVAGDSDIRRAEFAQQPRRIVRRLRQDVAEGAEHLPRQAARAPPAGEAARRHARVQQHQRDPPRDAAGDQVGPQLAFQQQRCGIRSPVIEEAGRPARHVSSRH